MRAQGEQDRTAEFKLSRDALVTKVNSWLQAQVSRRDAGRPLGDRPILSDNRIQVTDLGPVTGMTRSQVEELQAGISVTGDGIEQRIVLQSVVVHPRTGNVEIIEVSGTDPIAKLVHGDSFSTARHPETVVSFTQRDEGDQGSRYFTFSVGGDGSVRQNHLAPSGWHVGQAVRSPAEIGAASTAFDQLTRGLAQVDLEL